MPISRTSENKKSCILTFQPMHQVDTSFKKKGSNRVQEQRYVIMYRSYKLRTQTIDLDLDILKFTLMKIQLIGVLGTINQVITFYHATNIDNFGSP